MGSDNNMNGVMLLCENTPVNDWYKVSHISVTSSHTGPKRRKFHMFKKVPRRQFFLWNFLYDISLVS